MLLFPRVKPHLRPRIFSFWLLGMRRPAASLLSFLLTMPALCWAQESTEQQTPATVESVAKTEAAATTPDKVEVKPAAEGGLSSDAGENEAQAKHARMPEAGENLLQADGDGSSCEPVSDAGQ